MKNEIMSKRNTFIGFFILLVAFSRFLDHPWNFTPVAAMALFAGAYLKNRTLAYLLPLGSLLLSDGVLEIAHQLGHFEHGGFYSGMYYVYAGFALIVFLGSKVGKNIKAVSVIGGALAGSLSFFILTNLGTWMGGTLYPMTLEGLSACYAAGIPFFRHAVLGDLIYVTAFFGAFELMQYKIPALAKVKA
ncbi:MAG: hypothetical protein HRT72_13005 [Flavobacteriales bacterium]|nr:hypothetical protein [Flavobacteriales bacterium]